MQRTPRKDELLLLFLLFGRLGAFLAFHFLFALLDDFGLGGNSTRSHSFHRLFFFDAEGDNVGDYRGEDQ